MDNKGSAALIMKFNNKQMKKTIIILGIFALIAGCCTSVAAQGKNIQDVRILEFRGTTYNDLYVAYFNDFEENIFVSITQGNGEIDKQTPPEFDLYFILKKDNDTIPVGDFHYNTDLSADDHRETNIAGFVQYYTQWHTAEHSYGHKQFSLHIQALDNNHYSLKGEMILDNPANDTVKFNYMGEMNYVLPEVTRVTVYSPSDYKNSSGHFTMDGKKINTPFVFYENEKNSVTKIYLLDRVLLFDKKLEYGVSFELNPNHSFEGTFTYNKDIADEDQINYCRPAFFNQSITEYPNEATITIRKTKQHETYQIDYALTFSDNRIVKGVYTGKIPKR